MAKWPHSVWKHSKQIWTRNCDSKTLSRRLSDQTL